MSLYWPYLPADYVNFLEIQTAIIAVLILLSSVDDLFIDAWFWARKLYRLRYIQPEHKPLTSRQLRERDEQFIAIMVPAWHEYDVIAAMIENMVTVIEYRKYVVFVGTYVNDVATIAEVNRIARRYKQLVRVEVGHPGPTCKADCLNWIVQAIFFHERTNSMEFAGVVLHDSEDVLHPLELKYFNFLLPRKDLIQLPVMSLEREWYELVAGVYMDEFAEWHAKDLVVRESLSGMVPSAGVGTCFSRRALLTLASETNNQPFNTSSLTEDYDIGARLALHNMKSIMAHYPVEFLTFRKTWFGLGPEREFKRSLSLCVREFFPDTFRASYRQKARWMIGIGLQSWGQIGWQGTLADRYLMLRDRKGMVTSLVTIYAYVVAGQLIMMYLLAQNGIWSNRYPGIFMTSNWLPAVLWANALALLLRIVQRFYFVYRLYGWEHGLMSIPRLLIGNMVNFFAVFRAWRLFIANLLLGTPLVWDKTMHDFPSDEALQRRRQRLGELLISWQAIDEETLDSVLERQKEHRIPLGRYLVRQGMLDEDLLAEALAYQANLPRAEITVDAVKNYFSLLPADLCVRLRLLPIGLTDTGQIIIAVAAPLAEDELEEITTHLSRKLAQQIARESDITCGLRLLRGNDECLEAGPHWSVPLLGDLMVENGFVEPETLKAVLKQYEPSKDGLLGDFLVKRGILTPECLLKALEKQESLKGQVNA
jgi:adsorption protein B